MLASPVYLYTATGICLRRSRDGDAIIPYSNVTRGHHCINHTSSYPTEHMRWTQPTTYALSIQGSYQNSIPCFHFGSVFTEWHNNVFTSNGMSEKLSCPSCQYHHIISIHAPHNPSGQMENHAVEYKHSVTISLLYSLFPFYSYLHRWNSFPIFIFSIRTF